MDPPEVSQATLVTVSAIDTVPLLLIPRDGPPSHDSRVEALSEIVDDVADGSSEATPSRGVQNPRPTGVHRNQHAFVIRHVVVRWTLQTVGNVA
jgi:hypothetical protein